MRIHLPAVGPDLPIHPFTGLTAIGLRRNGAPIWPVRGGSGDGDGGDSGDGGDDGGDDGNGQDGGDADDLGDAGKQAIDRMKTERNDARKALRPWSALAKELGVKTPDELKALISGKTGDGGDGQDADKVRREALAEATKKANDRIVRSEVKAAAAGKLADPKDALVHIDLDQFDVDDDGEVDEDAINEAIADLIKRKPYLAAQGGRRFQGSGDGGHRGEGKPNLQPGLGRLQHAYAQSTKTRS